MVHDIIANYERLLVENYALKAMFSTANDARLRDHWESLMNEAIEKSGFRQSVHAKFEPLYAQVEKAIDDQAVLDLLLRLPAT